MDFREKTVLVTGGSRGLGAAIAKAFAAEGATVVVNYLSNDAAASEVADACRAVGGDGWAIKADVTSERAVRAMVGRVADEIGKIDVVVNNAFKPYVFDPDNRRMFWNTSWQNYQVQIDGALRATYNTCQAVLPIMKQRMCGSVVNIASDLVARPTIPYHDYTTAKSALIGFSRNLAAELGPLGIRVNCVAPGLIYPTDASRGTKEEIKDMLSAQTPLRRIATAEDVAGPVLFLASEWSSFMTGQTLYVDGGLVMN